MKIYINGEFYPEKEAKVSVLDHGYLYGDGVYETMRAYGAEVFEFRRHAERLAVSASGIMLDLPLDENGLYRAVHDTMGENGLSDAYIRVTVSRGAGEPGLDPELCPEPTVVVIARPAAYYPARMYEQGVKVSVVKTRRNHPECLDPAIKSNNFLNNIMAKVEAKQARAFEGIMLNHGGFVAEGTVSNIFMVEGGQVLTPPPMAGILEGVTRGVVIRLAEGLGIPLYEEPFTEVHLWQADEVFLTNTSMELMPVTDVDGHTIGDGSPGGITARLASAYKEKTGRCSRTP